MNKLLLLFVIWLSALSLSAERVDVQTAQKVAINLAAQIQKTGSGLKSISPANVSLVYTATTNDPAYRQLRNAPPPADYYAFNVGSKQGFVIVSGEDRVHPIIGYAPEGEFKTDNMPNNIKAWLERYQREITYAVTNKLEASPNIQQEWQAYMSNAMKSSITPVVQLETANWDQGKPYNNWCPIVDGRLAVTGCVATAQAIVMKYYEYPARATNGVSQYYGIPITYDNYDWSNMLLDYSYDETYPQTQTDAVAKLMFHCGANVEMEYSPSASGAITAYVAQSLINNFGYDKQARHINKSAYKWSEWKKIINKELDAKCPVIYDGQSRQGGHAFVCDGYTSEGAYHINWGWGGYSNGYFLLSTLDAEGSGDGFDDRQGLTIGIKPMVGNDYIQSLRMYKSITSEASSVTANTPFTLRATLISEGSTLFKGYINAALVDNNYKIRELISNSKSINLDMGWYNTFPLYCTPTLEPNSTDKVVVVYSQNETNWIIAQGGSDIASEMSVTSGVITPEPDDPNEPEAPLNVSLTYNEFNFSHIPIGYTISNTICFSSSDLQKPLRFRYKLKDPSWKSKMTLAYGNSWETINKLFEFDNDGIAWMDADGSKIEYGQIYQYIELRPDACGVMEYEIAVYDETQTQVYATYNCEATIVNPIQLSLQEIKGTKETNTPFSLNVSDFGDFEGKEIRVRMNLYTNLPSETITLNYIHEGKPETITLRKPYEESPSLQGEHLISSFSSTNGNYTIKSIEKIESAWLTIEFIDQSNNKTIPPSSGTFVSITDDVPVTYPVSLYLQNITATTAPDVATQGQPLNVRLTPAINYKLPETITITMDGRTLAFGSDYDYSSTIGEIYIPSVTGAVVITAEGVKEETFVHNNLVYLIYNSLEVVVVGPDIPEGVEREDWAVTSCTIPATVTYNNHTYTVMGIENEAFAHCSKLTSITLPNSLTGISPLAFNRCSSLFSIEIPASVSYIGYSVFDGCSKLTKITVNSQNASYKSSNGVLYDKGMTTLLAYPNMRGATYTIPRGVTLIEYRAFGGCSNLTNITISEGVETIKQEAFVGCSGLRSVTLPASIQYLNKYLFSGCEETLTEIHCSNPNPIGISEQNTFFITDDLNGDGVKDSGTATCKLYVPKGSKATYETASGWKEFSNIIEESDVANASLEESDNHVFVRDGIVYIEVPAQTEAQIINYSGQVIRRLNLPAGQTSINGLSKGLYIIKYAGNKTAKVSIF